MSQHDHRLADNLHRKLFLVIFIEGYVVLSAELIAIRQMLPFVGNGTESIAIIIAAVLLPLSFGYYYGGHLYQWHKAQGRHFSVRKRLLSNLIVSSLFLLFALSYLPLLFTFWGFDKIGIEHRVLQTSFYALLFLVLPTFLLGQTVPLISNYFSKKHLASIQGRMLFLSTTGSFLGSVLSTLVLMAFIGVNMTVIVTLLLLLLSTFLLNKRLFSLQNLMALTIFLVAFQLNSPSTMKHLGLVSTNPYNNIAILDLKDEDARILSLNHSASSKYAKDPKNRFEYVQFIENQVLKPIAMANVPKKILIIGAGGFTLGIDDTHNEYTYIDIDPSLKQISETHLFKSPLSANKVFYPEPARAFLRQNKSQFDCIILDAYSSINILPSQLLTQEFFRSIQSHLSSEGILAVNFIGKALFSDAYSVKFHNSLTSVFPNMVRQVIGDFDSWQDQELHNIIYLHKAKKHSSQPYTDDKNGYFWDL